MKNKGKKGSFLYRDGNNYKFVFKAEIPEGLKVGDETTYQKLGFTRKSFHDDVVGYKYDREADHNIVSLQSIEDSESPQFGMAEGKKGTQRSPFAPGS